MKSFGALVHFDFELKCLINNFFRAWIIVLPLVQEDLGLGEKIIFIVPA